MCSGVIGLKSVVVFILMVPVLVHRHLSVPLLSLTLLRLTTGTLGSVACIWQIVVRLIGSMVGLDMLLAMPVTTGRLA